MSIIAENQDSYKNLIGQRFGKLVVSDIKFGTGNRKKCVCLCDCGNYTKVSTANLRSGRISSCGCLLKTSLGEQHIELCLSSAEIEYEKEYRFSDLNNLRFDFYLPKLNRLIEFDGKQHYQECGGSWDINDSLQQRQERDKIKNNYAISNNIELVRIPYWKRDSITLDMLLGNEYQIKGE